MKKLGIIAIFIVVFVLGVAVGSSNAKQQPSLDNDALTTETPEPQGKVEVKSESKILDSDYTKIVGEVINKTSKSVTYVKITATFYDENKKVIATNFVYAGDTDSTPLEPQSTTPFELSSYPEKVHADSYKLDVSWK